MPTPASKKKSSRANATKNRINDLKKQLPNAQDWRTTDEQEIIRRQVRALENPPAIKNLTPDFRIESNFEVTSPNSDRVFLIEIRDLARRAFHSTSPDFCQNGLGTCKHTEAVLFHLQHRFPRLYQKALKEGGSRAELVVDHEAQTLRLLRTKKGDLPKRFRDHFDRDGLAEKEASVEVLEEMVSLSENVNREKIPTFRVSQEVPLFVEAKRAEMEQRQLQREYAEKVRSGEFPAHETKLPLFPYQQEGMLHLAFKGRAMVADEMGLGKTIQGIAAASLLHRLGKAQRCLVVAPASLKTEWEEQIEKFTHLPCEVVYGGREDRVRQYENPSAFFVIVNYEQVRSDSLDINAGLQPDIVILDEAQRIKNWATKTAQAIKRLDSRYAFVLTGTPIENRIDELYSIVEFLDPSLFGSLFRFNRNYYQFDEKGRPANYSNLAELRERVSPIVLRRRKAEVENELPERTDETRFVEMTDGQKQQYASFQDMVRQLIQIGKNRPLKREEQERLLGYLGCMRMLCDTEFILDQETRVSPKLDELAEIFETALSDPGTKIIVFSEWVRMLQLIKEHLDQEEIGYAWHTGSVPQIKRRKEIKAFKEDPDCRVFLCTESGGAGLNLQNANYVINVDLPWNPAKLEQRIARAWRKGQKKPVQVINLVAEGAIEHQMLQTLSVKQDLADGVLDGIGDLKEIRYKKGGDSFLTRLEQTLLVGSVASKKVIAKIPRKVTDPGKKFAESIQGTFGKDLVQCEEHFTADQDSPAKVLVVYRKASAVDASTLQERFCEFYPELKDKPEEVAARLVAIDEAAYQELMRFQELGLIVTNVRARRNLLEPAQAAPVELSEEAKRQLAEESELLGRKLKSSDLLLQADLVEEARPLLEAAAWHAFRHHLIESHQERLPDSQAELGAPEWKALIPKSWLDPYEQFIQSPDSPYFMKELHSAIEAAC